MRIEHKAVPVSGVDVINEAEGIVRAIVSVTGLRDRVKDNIKPGAYEKTLIARKPKGIWSHDWNKPIARTLDIKELMPGDDGLPKTLPNGDPWPKEAGGLAVKMQFNLKTQLGRDAYENVRFFGTDQEWSIGYHVPVGGARLDQKSGERDIEHLDLYEYSPVLFGAMPSACTTDVKTAQLAYKALNQIVEQKDFKALVDDKSAPDGDFKSDFNLTDEQIAEMAEDMAEANGDERVDPGYYDDEPYSPAESKSLTPVTLDALDTCIKSLQHVYDMALGIKSEDMDDEDEEVEEEDAEESGEKDLKMGDIIAKMPDTDLSEDIMGEIQDAADLFDSAIDENEDNDALDAADEILTVIERATTEGDVSPKAKKALQWLASQVATVIKALNVEDYDTGEEESDPEAKSMRSAPPRAKDEDDDEDDTDDEDEDDDDSEKKPGYKIKGDMVIVEKKTLREMFSGIVR